MTRLSRPISWLGVALEDFENFPADVQERCKFALGIAAEGGKAACAKPMRGLGSGVMEIALRYHGNAFRVIYALRIGTALWVIHAFQKKSTHGIKTPRHEIELIAKRMKRLSKMLEDEQ